MGFFLSKSATSAALNTAEILLLIFGFVLMIGVLGEYKIFPKLLAARHTTFEVLVVVGICGEFLADGGVFGFSYHLQTISDRELAALNKEAGEARQKAGESNERASRALERAAKADERAGNANELASRNEREAKRLDLERLKLEAQIQPRELTIEQRKAIRVLFAGSKTPVHLELFTYPFDSEAFRLCVSFREAGGFHLAGYPPEFFVIGSGPGDGPSLYVSRNLPTLQPQYFPYALEGIRILAGPGAEEIANAIKKIFEATNRIQVSSDLSALLPQFRTLVDRPNQIWIVVGSKPLPNN